MNLIEKLSSIIIKFILLLLFVLIVFSFYRILGIHLGYLNKETFSENYSSQLFIIILISFVIAVSLIWNYKKRVFSSFYTLVLLGCFIFPIIIFEYYLTVKRYAILTNSLVFDYNYDTRTKRQVADDINVNGGKAHPAFRVFKEDIGLTPLAYTPNTLIISKNEYGQHHKFLSDRHGFNNSDNSWDNKVDYLFVGDSFTEGCCLPDNNHFINIFNELVGNSLNLGISGNGPIINLGIIKEYAQKLNPKKIIWIHYEGNDLRDMDYYKKIKKFDKYLLKDYSQNLFEKNKEIEILLNDYYINKFLQRSDAEIPLKSINEIFFSKDRLFIKSIRNKINSRYLKSSQLKEFDFKRFEQIIKEAKRISDKINSKLIFINIPHEKNIKNTDKDTSKVKQILLDQQIEYYDLRETLSKNKNLKKLFAFEYGDTSGHFSFNGNEIVGKYLKKILLN